MTRVTTFAALAVFSIAVAGAFASCSIDKKSDTFTECSRPTDCRNGQICLNGICQAGDAGTTVDMANPDGPSCPSQCNSCKTVGGRRVCVINCMISPAVCNSHIECPSGFDCDISCSTSQSCQKGITCAGDQECAISCSGQGSCRDLACGDGACNVTCTGSNSCRNVDCNNSCACDVSCGANANCEGVTCTADSCRFLQGCSSTLLGCNTCP